MSLLMEALKVADNRKQQTELSHYLDTLQTEEKSPTSAKQLSTADESHTLEWETVSLQQSEQSTTPSEVEQWKRSLLEELEPIDYFKGELTTEKADSQPEFATVDFNLDDDLLKEYQQLQQTSDHQDSNHDQNNTHSVEEATSLINKLNELTSESLSAFESEISSTKQEARSPAFEPKLSSVEQTTAIQPKPSSVEQTLELAEQTLEWLEWLDWDEELRPSYSDSELNEILAISTEKGDVPFTFSDPKNSQPPAQRILEAGGKPTASKRVKWLYVLATVTFIGVVGTIGGFYYKNLCSNQIFLAKTEPICDTEHIKKALLHPFQNKETPTSVEPTIATTTAEPIVISVEPTITAKVPTESPQKNLPTPRQEEPVPSPSEPIAVKSLPVQETVAKKEVELPRETVKPRESVKSVTVRSQEPKVQDPKTQASVAAKNKPTVIKETPIMTTPKVEVESSPVPITFLQKDATSQRNKKIVDAYQAFQQKQDHLAQKLYQEVLHQDTRNRDALLGLAAIAARNGQAEQARYYYQQVLQFYPQDTLAQMGLNSVQLTLTPESKESQLRSLVERLPDVPDLHFDLGNFYASQQQWSAAQQAYFEAYRLDKKQADYAYNLAISLDRLNQPRLALNYYQEAIQLIKNQSITTYHFDPQVVQRRIQTLVTHTHHSAMAD